MKTLARVAAALTGLLLLMVLICGLWIKAQGANLDSSSLNFHMVLGSVSVVCGLCAAALVLLDRSGAQTKGM